MVYSFIGVKDICFLLDIFRCWFFQRVWGQVSFFVFIFCFGDLLNEILYLYRIGIGVVKWVVWGLLVDFLEKVFYVIFFKELDVIFGLFLLWFVQGLGLFQQCEGVFRVLLEYFVCVRYIVICFYRRIQRIQEIFKIYMGFFGYSFGFRLCCFGQVQYFLGKFLSLGYRLFFGGSVGLWVLLVFCYQLGFSFYGIFVEFCGVFREQGYWGILLLVFLYCWYEGYVFIVKDEE